MKKILICIALAILCVSCSSKDKNESVEDFVRKNAKLSTIKVVINNVGGDQHNVPFLKDATCWIEYKGYVSLGIDLEKISIKTEGDDVTIKLPDVEIIDHGILELLDENIILDNNVLNIGKFTESEINTIQNTEEEKMVNNILENDSMKNMAESRAKMFLEGLVNIYNEKNSSSYRIYWK